METHEFVTNVYLRLEWKPINTQQCLLLKSCPIADCLLFDLLKRFE